MKSRVVIAVVAVSIVMGCASFEETHYLRSEDPVTGEPVNYFRLTVEGSSKLSRARYISGYYDERAVDIFFNEMKTEPDTGAISPIFRADQTNPGTESKLTPLTPENGHGAFLMIYSTNAKAVADAIGTFAESQVVADSVTRLVNRGAIASIQNQKAEATTRTARMVAFHTELDALYAKLDPMSTSPSLESQCVRILRSISAALGGAAEIKTLDDAKTWFDGLSSNEGVQQ